MPKDLSDRKNLCIEYMSRDSPKNSFDETESSPIIPSSIENKCDENKEDELDTVENGPVKV